MTVSVFFAIWVEPDPGFEGETSCFRKLTCSFAGLIHKWPSAAVQMQRL